MLDKSLYNKLIVLDKRTKTLLKVLFNESMTLSYLEKCLKRLGNKKKDTKIN